MSKGLISRDSKMGTMPRIMAYRRVIPVLLLTLSVSACVSNASRDSSFTPAEWDMHQESDFFSNSNVQACLATGSAAALLTYLLSEQDSGRRSAIAFAAGCGIGIGVNSYVQQQRGQYRNNEQRINVYIADVRKSNQHLRKLIRTSNRVMEQDRRRIADVNDAYNSRSISRAEAQKRMARIRDNRDHLQDTLNALKKKQADWERVARMERRSGVNTARLDAEIGRLREQVSLLETEIDLMDQQISASPIPA